MITTRVRVLSNVRIVCCAWCSIIMLTRARSTMGEPVVSVKQGKLKGAVVESSLSSSYIAFKGIPFAAPPIGDLRFKDPQPPAPWSGIKDTTKIISPPCPQLLDVPPFDIVGDEDCLHLNVYTNSLDQSNPVMFYIHGGAFIIGSSNFEHARPDYLLTKDVVLVTVHYRLGAFGFLNLGHNVAPGNQALKDLIAALEWVKENIANFGGDPKNVTVFGVSAGGALSQHLLLSPRAKGLFHKAILQSGTAFSPWSLNQSSPEHGFKLASLLGKDSTDPLEVVEFLRTVPAENIVKAQSLILSTEEAKSYKLAFGVNCDEVAENSVLPRPLNELQEADVPLMLGYTSHEFLMFFKDKSEEALKAYDQYLHVHVKNLAALKQLSDADTEKLLLAVRDFYFNGKSVCEETIDGLVEFMTDVYFGIPAKLVLENRLKTSTRPTYLYRFSYVGNEKTATDLLLNRLIKGAAHVDETAYLFYLPLCKTENPDAPAFGTKDRATLERMTTLWTSFAKTGNPTACKNEFVTIDWRPVTAKESCYLEIGEELETLPITPHVLNLIN